MHACCQMPKFIHSFKTTGNKTKKKKKKRGETKKFNIIVCSREMLKCVEEKMKKIIKKHPFIHLTHRSSGEFEWRQKQKKITDAKIDALKLQKFI